MTTMILIFITLILIVRVVEMYLFLRRLSIVVERFKWEKIESDPDLLVQLLSRNEDDELSFDSEDPEWGLIEKMKNEKSLLQIFFTPKRLSIKNLFSEKIVVELEKMELI